MADQQMARRHGPELHSIKCTASYNVHSKHQHPVAVDPLCNKLRPFSNREAVDSARVMESGITP